MAPTTTSDHIAGNEPSLFISAIVGEVAGVVEAARIVSAQSSFHRSWQFGVALRHVRSLLAYKAGRGLLQSGSRFSEDGYDEVAEVDANDLAAPDSTILELLLGRLLRASEGSSDDIAALDPFPTG